jgi:hypothetical protein
LVGIQLATRPPSLEKICSYRTKHINENPIFLAYTTVQHVGGHVIGITTLDGLDFIADGHLKSATFDVRHLRVVVFVQNPHCTRFEIDFDEHNLIVKAQDLSAQSGTHFFPRYFFSKKKFFACFHGMHLFFDQFKRSLPAVNFRAYPHLVWVFVGRIFVRQ